MQHQVEKWIKQYSKRGNLMDFAAATHRLEYLIWMHENGIRPCTTRAMDSAARNGNLKIVQWLHENRTEGCTTAAMDNAAINGHFKMVKWLHENRTEGCTTAAMDNAAGRGHFKMVKWFHENRTEGCTTGAMDNAVCRGHFEIVKWLHENRTEGCTREAMNDAIMFNHVEIVQYLDEVCNIQIQPLVIFECIYACTLSEEMETYLNNNFYMKFERKKKPIPTVLEQSIECDVCCNEKTQYNSCIVCKHSICMECRLKVSKCPFCRESYMNDKSQNCISFSNILECDRFIPVIDMDGYR